MKLPFALAAALVACASIARAEEPAWPELVLTVERAAIQDPRPGLAWTFLKNFAVENRLERPWQQRWESRVDGTDGAAISLLLGWSELEAGKVPAARGRFEHAVILAPKSHHAWMALAELQIRAAEAAGEASARKAMECATNDSERVEAWRLPPLLAQERGDLANAWAMLKAIEAEPLSLSVRLDLMPDFARAHLATGDAQEWADRLVAAATASADDAAVGAGAALAMGDPALAHRVVTRALAADDTNATLRRLAATAASASGFLGEAAMRTETSIGDKPNDDTLIDALKTLVRLGAPEHAVRVCRRHAAQLAPIVARWRELLPGLWRLGVAQELREIFAGQAGAGGWELALAQAELAILEKDYASAEEPLWRVLAAEFDRDEMASTTRAQGNAPAATAGSIPVRGYGLAQRFSQVLTQIERIPVVFDPNDQTAPGWVVFSLCDARDLVLAYLQRLARRGDEKAPQHFLARLREQIAHWPAEERLLAFAIVANPEGIVDTAAELFENPSLSGALDGFAFSQVKRLRLVPNLGEDTSERVARLLRRGEPKSSTLGSPSQPPRWMTLLENCWTLYDAGKFAEADAAFAESLKTFSMESFGPPPAEWVRFHNATIYGVGAFASQTQRAEAASYALRWMALQTPRRADWPAVVRPEALWQPAEPPIEITPLFNSSRQDIFNVYAPQLFTYFRPLGGNLPEALWPAFFFLAIHLDRSSGRDEGRLVMMRKADGLPPESERLLMMASLLPSLFRSHPPAMGEIEQIFDTADGQTARLLVQMAEKISSSRDGEPKKHDDFITKWTPHGTVGQGAWRVAWLHLAEATGVPALLDQILELPIDVANYGGAKEVLVSLADSAQGAQAARMRALAAKLTLVHRKTSDPLPSETEERLRSFVDAAEVDQAVALARQVLDWPQTRVERNEKLVSVQKEALNTLRVCGELNGWFSDLQKRAYAGTAADWRRLAEQCDLILQIIPESADLRGNSQLPAGEQEFDQLAVVLRRNAVAARWGARLALVRLEPEDVENWQRVLALRTDRQRTDARIEVPIDLETMLRGAKSGLNPELAAAWFGDDLEKLAELTKQWPELKPRNPGEVSLPDVARIPLALRLWLGGKQDEAIDLLEKLFAGADADVKNADQLRGFLLEALAVRGDQEGMVRVLIRALRQAAAPVGDFAAFPYQDHYGNLVNPLHPLQPILDQATALGLTGKLVESLAADNDPLAGRLSLLLRVQMRDASALADVTMWIKKAPPMQTLEELAKLLAPWPEARSQTKEALNRLEPEYGLMTQPERVRQLLRHVILMTQCGMDQDADHWLHVGEDGLRDSDGDRPQILFDALEAFVRLKRSQAARGVAEELAALAKSGRWSEAEIVMRLREMADMGRIEEAALVIEVFSARQALKDEYSLRVLDACKHQLAAQKGDWASFNPVAWLKDIHEDGTSEVGWGWSWSVEDGKGTNLFLPDLTRAIKATPMRAELYFGRQADRLEPFGVAVATTATGVVRGPFTLTDGFLAAGITVEGRTFLGRQSSIHAGKNLLPPLSEQLRKLPSAIWSQTKTGPEAETLHSVALTPTTGNGFSIAAAELEVPSLEGKGLLITGWIKGGQINHGFIAPNDQRKNPGFIVAHGEPYVWKRVAVTLTARNMEETGGKGARHLLILAPGGDYSGLRVIAADPAPPPGDRPRK